MKAGNGILKGEVKVKGGKLIKCMVEIENGFIKNVKITGDFFIYPEETIERVEELLKGAKFNEERIRERMKEAFRGAEIIGASLDDFIRAIVHSRLIE